MVFLSVSDAEWVCVFRFDSRCFLFVLGLLCAMAHYSFYSISHSPVQKSAAEEYRPVQQLVEEQGELGLQALVSMAAMVAPKKLTLTHLQAGHVLTNGKKVALVCTWPVVELYVPSSPRSPVPRRCLICCSRARGAR